FVQNQGNLFVQNQENSFVQDQENLFVQNQENSFVQNQENLFVQNQENSFVQNQENSFVQNQEISVVQNQENSVVQNQVISLLQNLEVPSVEDKEAIQAFDNIVLKIVPRSMILSDKLRALRMPMVLKDTLYLDHSMHQSFNMLLKFPEENTVAKVLHMFTQSSYFLEVDNQKKYSIEFPVTLMKYFNATVHTHLTYRIEQLYSLRNKGMTYFQQKIYNQPIVNYFFKNQLYPKKIWCYLYGPMHLLRLLQHLPSILSINSWHPEYESDTFALHIERLL
ncbi:PREDICTED: uncharacterized protein LOC107171108, partial [Diuraphis noxia]|uniref:uncharacterized protein LOC107171108 n=1 Tax=Diuraphis noxia TaxID=143948 RepID=UPI0007639222